MKCNMRSYIAAEKQDNFSTLWFQQLGARKIKCLLLERVSSGHLLQFIRSEETLPDHYCAFRLLKICSFIICKFLQLSIQILSCRET